MIPAKVYMGLVKSWAKARGMKFFSWKDQRKALANYELFGCKLN